MSPASTPSADLVPAGPPSSFPSQLPVILSRAGAAAVFATEGFFFGKSRNAHTRAAYLIAGAAVFKLAESRDLTLSSITPCRVGQYIDGLEHP